RITVSIPNKGEGSAAGGSIDEVVQPSPKKRKGSNVTRRRTLALTTGSAEASGDLDRGDKDVPTVDVLV
ncbi:hypothetical protein A2U01_0116019, partial [Trifolium medium]|nr:hypothetical protein [Trifolium medium]